MTKQHYITAVLILLFSVIISSSDCGSSQYYDGHTTGNVSTEELFYEPYSSWVYPVYADYQFNQNYSLNQSNIHIEVYFGSWCWMSRQHVPEFIKIAQYYNLNHQLFELNTDKGSTEGFERGKEIYYVPTFVVYRNGTEIGRIIEQSTDLAKDLEQIINQ